MVPINKGEKYINYKPWISNKTTIYSIFNHINSKSYFRKKKKFLQYR